MAGKRSHKKIRRKAELHERELSKYRRREKALAQKITSMEHLIAVSPAVNYTCKPEDNYCTTFISEKVKEQLGYAPHDFTDDPEFWASRIHPDDKKRILGNMNRLFETGAHKHEYRFQAQNGSYRWMYDEMKLVVNDQGRPTKIVGYWVDITDRKEMEEALQLSEQKLQSVKEISELANSSLDLNTVLHRILNGTLEASGASGGIIFLADKKTKKLSWGTSIGFSKAFISDFTNSHIKIGEGLTGRIAQTGKPIYIHSNSSDDPRIARKIIQDENFNSFIGVPLSVAGENIGVMNILTKPPEILEEDKITLIAAIGMHVGSAIRNAQLYEERSRTEEELKNSQEKLEQLIFERTEKLLRSNKELRKTIRKLKEKEIELRQSTELNETILNAIDESISIINAADYTIISTNLAFQKQYMLGEDAVGKKCHEMTHNQKNPCLPPHDACPIAETLKNRQPSSADHVHFCKDGTQHFVEITTFPIKDEDGKVRRIVHSSRDITVRKQTELALKKAKNEAEKANRLKTEFLANMSHEIRTPLNGIIGFTDIMSEMDVSSKQEKFLRMIKSSSERLLGIVNDLLDFSKIEAQKLNLENTRFNLYETLEESLTLLSFKAKEKSLSLTWHIKDGVPVYLMGDSTRLAQILVNLVFNAIKFTEKGEIKVTVDTRKKLSDTVILHFAVKDTGIGIPKDKQNIIFDPFFQVDGSFNRKQGGSGLGLAICSQLVKMMKGDIWLENNTATHQRRKNDALGNKHKGSTFHFTVGLKIAPERKENHDEDRGEKTSHDLPEKLHVLLVEDDYINQVVAMEIIKQQNWQVTAVENGLEALKTLTTGNFDLILMDIQMPDMDGFEATAAIRKREKKTKTRMPIIAMTAHAMKGDREMCLDVGMDDYVSKPINPEELFAAIRRQKKQAEHGMTTHLDN